MTKKTYVLEFVVFGKVLQQIRNIPEDIDKPLCDLQLGTRRSHHKHPRMDLCISGSNKLYLEDSLD